MHAQARPPSGPATGCGAVVRDVKKIRFQLYLFSRITNFIFNLLSNPSADINPRHQDAPLLVLFLRYPGDAELGHLL